MHLFHFAILFCYEEDFTATPSDDKEAEINQTVNSTSKYLDDHLNTEKP